MTIHDSLDDLGRLIESYKTEGHGENEMMEQLAMNLMRQALMPRFVRGLMLQAERERDALLETVSSKLLPPPIPQQNNFRPQPIFADVDGAIDDCERPKFLDRHDLTERVTDYVNGYRRTA